MSGFLMVLGPWARRLDDPTFAGKVRDALAPRGQDQMALRHLDDCATLHVSNAWEAELLPRAEPPPAAIAPEHILVAADAALYYRAELHGRLGIAPEPSREPAHLIAAAFVTSGPRLAEQLEGDFAFAAWDTRARTLYAARDPFGVRSLFWASAPGGLLIASSPRAILVFMPQRELNRRDLLRALTGCPGDGSSTPWTGISELPAGCHLQLSGDTAPHISRYWYPRAIPEYTRRSASDAAVELRSLLAQASLERMSPRGAAIAMSGGRDSTAIVGSVESLRRAQPEIPALHLLSYGYPANDPGNEDEFVNQVAAEFGLAVHWIDTERVPLLRDPASGAATRSRPEPHPYEGLNRALAARARELGVPVLMNGNGGDNFFGLSDTWLADLLRQGRLLRLRSELRARGYRGAHAVRELCVRPALPFALFDAAEKLLRRRIWSRSWEHAAPPFLTPGIIEREGIIEEDREDYRRTILANSDNVAERLRLFAMLFSGFWRMSASLFEISLGAGVELRLPFHDRRIADFAWSRPVSDLVAGREQKVILRRTMQGVLPPAVVAPRPLRTGTADSYFRRKASVELPVAARDTAAASALSELGLVDQVLLRRAISGFHSADPTQQLLIVTACNIDTWVRAQNSQLTLLPGSGNDA